MISVSCTCGRRFKAEDYHAGKRTRCPVCGKLLIIGQPGAIPGGVHDDGEVPSWWFPTTRGASSGVGNPPQTTGSNPDEVHTVVLPHQSGPKMDRTESGIFGSSSGRPAGMWPMMFLLAGIVALALAGIAFTLWLRQPELVDPNRVGPRADTPAPPAEPEPPPPVRTAEKVPPQLLVPAYFYPAGDGLKAWQRLISAAEMVPIVAIANPNNGAGEQRNTDYFLITKAAVDKGVRVIGYVATDYARRPLNEVTSEIDRWLELYPHIKGFFIDQQSTSRQSLDYYLKVRSHARQRTRNALVIANPGAMCDAQYFVQEAADVICVFASFQGFTQLHLPDILSRYAPTRFAALLYNIPDKAAMHTAMNEAAQKHIGYFYISDASQGANPYAHLPTYWDDLVQEVAKEGRTPSNAPSKTPN